MANAQMANASSQCSATLSPPIRAGHPLNTPSFRPRRLRTWVVPDSAHRGSGLSPADSVLFWPESESLLLPSTPHLDSHLDFDPHLDPHLGPPLHSTFTSPYSLHSPHLTPLTSHLPSLPTTYPIRAPFKPINSLHTCTRHAAPSHGVPIPLSRRSRTAPRRL
jgi:hypothetical protein